MRRLFDHPRKAREMTKTTTRHTYLAILTMKAKAWTGSTYLPLSRVSEHLADAPLWVFANGSTVKGIKNHD
jgi:hypothetical protein